MHQWSIFHIKYKLDGFKSSTIFFCIWLFHADIASRIKYNIVIVFDSKVSINIVINYILDIIIYNHV